MAQSTPVLHQEGSQVGVIVFVNYLSSLFNSAGQVEVLHESLADEDWHDQGALSIHFDGLSVLLDLAP